MLTDLATVTLRHGATMTIRLMEPPQEDLARRLLHFLEHKDDDSLRGLRQRVQGMYAARCVDRYFIGEVAGEIVGQAWYGLPRVRVRVGGDILSQTPSAAEGDPPSVPPTTGGSRMSPPTRPWGIGNFGHVYTEPSWRGQGVASEIVRVLVDHFQAEPTGQCLLCSASAQSGRIYRQYGFEFIPPTAASGPMGLVKGETFAELEQRYFAPGRPVRVVAGHIGHRHDIDRLMDFSPAWIEARQRWHFAFVSSTVPTYIAALHQVEDGRGVITVLQTDAGSIVGYAYALNLGSRCEEHLLTLDFAIHPHYLAQAGTLLDGTVNMSRQRDAAPVHAFVAACDEAKLAALRDAGFAVAYTFPCAFVLDGAPHDVLMLAR